MYSAVTVSFNTVVIPSVIVTPFLVQVTVVTGPPIEVHVNLNLGLYPLRSESTVKFIPPSTLTYPVYSKTSDNGHSDKRTTSLYTMDKLLAPLPLTVHTFLPPTKGQPPNNGQNARPHRVHYLEVPLYKNEIRP